MEFDRITKSISIRVLVLTGSVFLFVHTIYFSDLPFTQVVLAVLIGLQVILLIKNIEKQKFSVDDLLASLNEKEIGNTSTFEYTMLKKKVLKALEEKTSQNSHDEEDFQYMKNIVQHIGIGIITFSKTGQIQIMNTAAKRLLKVKSPHSIEELNDVSERLVEVFKRLKTGGRELLRLEVGGDIVQLAIYAIQLFFHGEEFKLVSIQNIQNELEEKEMDAWQNLVRVLTHEIMNSITPITSLATTVEEDLQDVKKSTDSFEIQNEQMEDITMAIGIIKKRGEGLVRFVQDFRNLTHVPQPKIAEVSILELFDEVKTLMAADYKNAKVIFSVIISPENMVLYIDKELVTQVLINLLKNAMQAFDPDCNEKKVELKAFYGEKGRPTLSVSDNGEGIDPEALDKIFIPFFTTKKSGSGIGLSLSRQIMRNHKGSLGVKTKVGEGTEFFLKF